jgi:putative exosortase-associated protein (TIGR04073 family)
MKLKAILFLCIMIAVFCAFALSYADDGGQSTGYGYEPDKAAYDNTPMSKLNRGAVNSATFWAEIPADVAKVSKEKDPVAGCTLGVMQGTFNAVVRGFTGLFDVVTFFAPPYNKPLMKPEYAVNRADENIKEYLW